MTAPFVVAALFAPGFLSSPLKYQLTSDMIRITFPYLLFITLVTLISGTLNAHERFWAAAAAPVLMNVVLIAAMLMADRFGWDMGLAMAWSTPVSGLVQLATVWVAARRMGFPLRRIK